jgi:glycosyltransferase involved in cell wall biosynthesis
MKAKHIVIKTARKLPISKKYIKSKELKNAVQLQKDEIIGLRQAVEHLEKRNDEWAAEVRTLRGDSKSLNIVWPIRPEDIIAADWTKTVSSKPRTVEPPFTINWVVPPMGLASGGHADIFRTIAYLESKGHTCKVYFYDAQKETSFETIKENLTGYTPIKAELFYNAKDIADCDAIFATSWHTAYPVFNYKGSAKKYYYVQDFEPYFAPAGTYSTLAENTYRFGFRGITLGRWLSQKLSKEYSMDCDYMELGLNSKEYYLTNAKPRKKVLFYARPVTPRRGFELGVLALELFHKEHPQYEIHFLGWDISPYQVPFPYINHGVLSPEQLNELYNKCAAGLVLSFTNMSLLPLELLASGCRPIVNDAENTRMVSYAEQIQYALPTPRALADALQETISHTSEAQVKEMSDFSQSFKWDTSNEKVEDILLRSIAG